MEPSRVSGLEVRDVAVEVGGVTLVEGLTFSLRAGDKMGVVGRNGAGKTSTMRVLAGEAPALAGTITIDGELGYLRQDPRQHQAVDDQTALDHILSARGLAEMAHALDQARIVLESDHSPGSVARYSQLEEAFSAAGGYQADAEAHTICAGLGLPAGRLALPVRALSGGERRRIELARILFGGSDVLLLDEPTNHLDADAKDWLMSFLAEYPGALMVVSHDLMLLDRSITRVLHLDPEGVVLYRGSYTQYQISRAADEDRLTKTAVRQEAEIKRLTTLADSMRGQTAKRARKAKTLDTRVIKLQMKKVAAPKKRRKVAFRFPDPPHMGRVALVAEGLTKGYGGPPVFEDVTFDVERGERVLILGLNGAGKTSLLRILAGQSEPDVGSFRLGTGVSLGYYAQEHEQIRSGVQVIAHMREASTGYDQELRKLLGMFDLSGDIAFQDAGTLSGGEKTKLALAQLVAGRKNLILLDEPTNNLDPPSRSAIAKALGSWQGSMILVSHDEEFVEQLDPDRVLVMPEGDLGYFDEDMLELVALA